jgi:hypothetical protein
MYFNNYNSDVVQLRESGNAACSWSWKTGDGGYIPAPPSLCP